MPIDSSIYAQQQPFRLNTPFEALGQIGLLQRQQQEIASAKTLEQERQSKIAEDAKKQQEADRFNAIIGNPDLTPDAFLEQVRKTAPEHYGTARKLIDDARKNAADLAEKDANTQRANAEMQTHQQTYLANQGAALQAAGNTPEAFELLMKIHQEAFPKSKQPDAYRQMVLQQGPQSIPLIAKMMQGLNPAVQKQATEQPTQAADSAIAQQVAAGTVGGLTPEQQAQRANQQAQRKQEDQRIALEAQRVALEKKKAADAAALTAKGKPLSALEADKISEFDTSVSSIGALRNALNKGSTGLIASAEARLVPNFMAGVVPGATDAKATQAEIGLAQQVVGRIIHGGVMRANDQLQAQKYMPQLGDSKGVIKEKLDSLEKLATEKRRDHVSNLGKVGYDVSNFAQANDAAPAQTPAPQAAPSRVYYDSYGRPIQK